MTANGATALKLATAVLVGLASLWPPAHADQPAGISRIGVLIPRLSHSPFEEGMRDALRELGYVEGKNIFIELRRSAGSETEMRSLALDLARSKVDLIVTRGSPATRAALEATALPIVFVAGDPVASGFAASLARPGGNGTGVSVVSSELNTKRLELLHQLVPRARRIVYLWNPANPVEAHTLDESRKAARTLGVKLDTLEARNAGEIDAALSALRRSPPDALVLSAEGFFVEHKAKIAEAVRKAGIPAMFHTREYHDARVLMSYGPSEKEVARMLAGYVDKILKGAKPADLPIEQPTKFELVVNLKIAKAIGITVPQSILLRADELIR